MRDLDDVFDQLAASPFRRGFRLGPKDADYLRQRGMDRVMVHAARFVAERLQPARPIGDGKQTPMRGHPAFVAQHATATCCRGCLAKWHAIEKDRVLTEREVEHVLAVIYRWLEMQGVEIEPQLFD